MDINPWWHLTGIGANNDALTAAALGIKVRRHRESGWPTHVLLHHRESSVSKKGRGGYGGREKTKERRRRRRKRYGWSSHVAMTERGKKSDMEREREGIELWGLWLAKFKWERKREKDRGKKKKKRKEKEIDKVHMSQWDWSISK